MKKLMIAVAIGLAATIAAAQSLVLVEGTAEMTLADVTFPNSIGGFVSYTTCETCEAKRMQIDSQTVFVGGSGAVPLSEFLNDVAELRETEAGRETFVSLFYDLNTNRVTRIRLFPDAS